MKNLAIFLLFIFIQIPLLKSLSVTPDVSSLGCGITPVTFTFDCAFSGNVVISTDASQGVGFPFSSGTPYFESVSSGSVTVYLEILSNAPTSFNIDFLVTTSDLPCTITGDSADASLSHTCTIPENDDCLGSLLLEFSTNSCVPIPFITSNSSSSGQTPSCGGGSYHDLWYIFEANNTDVTLDIASLPGTIGYYALYDNCPGSGTELECDIVIPMGATVSIDFNGLSVNSLYFLQLLFLPGEAGNNQEICLHSETVVLPCDLDVYISDTGPDYPFFSHKAVENIFTLGPTNVSGSDIMFEAGLTIELESGFDSGVGGFEAKIAPCLP